MTIWRILVSLLAGTMVGGLLLTLHYLFGQLVSNGPEYMVQYGLGNAMGILMMSCALWLAGVLVLGGPCWFFLHRAGKISARHAGALGFALVFSFIFLINTIFALWVVGDGSDGSHFSAGDSGGPTWVDNQLTLHGWVSAAQEAGGFALAGVLVALSIWWVAYKVWR